MHPFKMRFSKVEFQHLGRAWLAISLAFAVLNYGGFSLSAGFLLAAAISAFTVGTGFLLHELMHKYLAQKYGCRAEFRAFDFMLVLSVAMSFFGFIFAAPGGVFIQGHVNVPRNGRISAAGPLTNIVLAGLFIILKLASSEFFPNAAILSIAEYGASINAWLAVFNMLPMAGLDGSKVLRWNMKVFAALLAIALSLMVVTFVV